MSWRCAPSPDVWTMEKGFPGAAFSTANTTAVMSSSVGIISSKRRVT